MRKVRYSEYVKHEENHPSGELKRRFFELEEQGEAFFHQFGINYEETGENSGAFTTAIIELPDGQVKSIPADQIRFITD